ncbi:LOW QUALITY PROTEIN: cilium assembly protein DZIP1 [Phycodurus eques]|uniref:LOW QUALITY PROTEIN: cilium assembly protein DZIP1 n=1 Tax=Phycodurus eques TaxID=693459 RepID=UPI002ACD8257|nr:LOW QUALITY PROTEIN: cilium assembly protein DZIP1 [Phycodurus eques]
MFVRESPKRRRNFSKVFEIFINVDYHNSLFCFHGNAASAFVLVAERRNHKKKTAPRFPIPVGVLNDSEMVRRAWLEQPFQDGAYYPYSSDTQGNHSSAGIPSLLNSPLSQHAVKVQSALGMAPAGAPPTILAFRFRQRRESVDWRRIHAVDIDLVISQLDVDVLQEHISTVTFCSLDGERCQRCQSPVDRALIKILQLAQLTVEWLLHCQECLTLNLQAAEERLASANMQQEQLLAQMKKQEESMMAMTAELKNRRKIIRKQQTLFAPQITNSQKCTFCKKKFLTASFLQSHIQRRHPDENDIQLLSNSEEKSQIQALKFEMNSLKEQIVQQQQTLEAKTAENQKLQRHLEESEQQMRESEKKSQIESLKLEIKNLKDLIQHQYIIQARPAEDEKQQSKDKDLLKELDRFKEVEMVQIQAIQKLEHQQKQQDKKWESRLGKITALHESEKNDLQKELSRLQSAVLEHQEHSKRQLQEMRRKLQEKEQTIQDQREQIQNTFSNPSTKVLKVPVLVSAPAPEPKTKKVVLEELISYPQLDPIQELSEEEEDLTSIPEKRPVEKKSEPFPEKKHRVSVRRNPNKTEIKRHLEQVVMTKLESLGVKPDQRKLKTKELRSVLATMHTKRQSHAKQLPDYWRHRVDITNTLERKLSLKRKDSNLQSRHCVQVLQTRPRSSSLPSRASQGISDAVARQAKTPQPAPRVKTTIQPKTSTPSHKTAQREHTPKTPPFSSFVDSEEDDTDMEDSEPPQHQWGKTSQAKINKEEAVQTSARKSNVIQARPALTRLSSSKSQLGGGVTTTAIMKIENDDDDDEDDDDELSDVSELQEIDSRQLQRFKDQNGNIEKSNSGKVSDLARKIERQIANKPSKKPVGGVSILPQSKDEVQEFLSSDLDESSEDANSYFEDRQEKLNIPHNSGTTMKSQDSVSTSVWDSSTGKDTSIGKASRSGLTEAGTGSTLKSSLCYLSDICDSEDLNN